MMYHRFRLVDTIMYTITNGADYRLPILGPAKLEPVQAMQVFDPHVLVGELKDGRVEDVGVRQRSSDGMFQSEGHTRGYRTYPL